MGWQSNIGSSYLLRYLTNLSSYLCSSRAFSRRRRIDANGFAYMRRLYDTARTDSTTYLGRQRGRPSVVPFRRTLVDLYVRRWS